MATLDWITIKGFKSIKNVERLKLNPINLLIGPNGSGTTPGRPGARTAFCTSASE